MLVIKYHRIHSVGEHFPTERTMQFEGGHNDVHTNRSGLYFPILYRVHHQPGLLRKKKKDRFSKLNILTLFFKFTSEYALWCSWELVGMLLALGTHGCLVGLKVCKCPNAIP